MPVYPITPKLKITDIKRGSMIKSPPSGEPRTTEPITNTIPIIWSMFLTFPCTITWLSASDTARLPAGVTFISFGKFCST